MNFTVSFWDPFKPYEIKMGEMDEAKVLETFEKVPWTNFLERMAGKKPSEINYSPTIEITNTENKTALTLSATGLPDKPEYYIFFKRSKKVKQLFGLSEKVKENYLSEIKGQTYDDASNCLKAFIKNDLDFIENKMG